MLSQKSLSKTYKLINSTNITIITSEKNKLGYLLARSLCCVHFNNVQYYCPTSADKILDNVKQLSNQYKGKNHSKIELLILNFDADLTNGNCMNFFELLSKLNELSKAESFKIIVLLSNKNSHLFERNRQNLTAELQQRLLILTMNEEKQIKLTIETGKNKGKAIFYELDDFVDLLKEINL